MRWDIFTKKVSDDINRYSSDVNPSDIWGSIESNVDEINMKRRKNRRLLIIFLFAGVSIILGISSAIYWTQYAQSNNASVKIKEASKKEDTNTTALNPAHSKNDMNKASSSTQTPNDNNPSTLSAVHNNATNVLNHSDRPTQTTSATATNHISPSSPSQRTKSPEDPILPPTNDIRSDPENTYYLEVNSDYPMQKNKEEQEETTIKEKDLNSKNQQLNLRPLPQLTIQPFRLKSLNTIPEKNNSIDLFNDSADYASEENSNSDRFQKDLTVGIGLIGGISYANKSLGIKNASGADLVALRKNTESSLEASHLGLDLSLRHKSGFEVSTGIMRTSIAERFDYNTSIAMVDTIDGIVARRIDLNGDTLSIFGDVPRTTTTNFTKKVYNTYNLFEVPVLLGYIHNTGSWKIGAQAGVFMNLSLKTEGRILSNATEDVDIKTRQNELFKPKIGLSYYLGATIQRRLFSNVDISLSPFVRIYPDDFTVSDYSISQKYIMYGGQIGLKYWLGR